MSTGTSYIILIENQQIPYVLLPFPFYIFIFGIVVYTKQYVAYIIAIVERGNLGLYKLPWHCLSLKVQPSTWTAPSSSGSL